MEQALCAAPSARGITVADLEVVRECAGSPGPLKRFVPETSSPSDIMMNTPPHLRGGEMTSGSKRSIEDSPSYTLSPQSALKPPSFGDGQLGSSYGDGRDKSVSPRSASSPPVAVYSYATSAGSARGGNGAFAGRPPRGDRATFKPGSLPHPRSGTSFGNRAGPPSKRSRRLNLPVRRSGRREMSIWTRSSDFCSRRWEMGSGWRLKARLA